MGALAFLRAGGFPYQIALNGHALARSKSTCLINEGKGGMLLQPIEPRGGSHDDRSTLRPRLV